MGFTCLVIPRFIHDAADAYHRNQGGGGYRRRRNNSKEEQDECGNYNPRRIHYHGGINRVLRFNQGCQ